MTDAISAELAYLRLDPTLDSSIRSLWTSPLGDRLTFAYIDFDGGIGEQVAPLYADTDIIGRAEPYKAFIGLPSKEFTLNFTFINQDGDAQREVVDAGRFLDGLKYPLYSEAQGRYYPPPPCILKIGSLFTARVILTGGDPNWKTPVNPDTLLPDRCEFSAQFSVVRKRQPDLGYRFDGQWQ